MSVSLKHTLDQGREEFKAAAYAAPPSDHDPDIKEKPRASKPAASPFNASSSPSSTRLGTCKPPVLKTGHNPFFLVTKRFVKG